MAYRVTVNLVPRTPGYIDAIHNWTSRNWETIAHSVDDAFQLLDNGSAGSKVRVWNLNHFTHFDKEKILDRYDNLEFRNIPNSPPWMINIIDTLPTSDDYPFRALEEINFLTIHHTVSWSTNHSLFENCERFANYHIRTKGWPGIGYHFMVAPNGEIARLNELTRASYHAGTLASPGDENRMSIGIALGGDFRLHPPTSAQQTSAAAIVADLRKELPGQLAVVPHRRMPGAATVCPGVAGRETWLKLVSGQEEWL